MHDIPARLGIYVDAWDKHTHHIEVYGNLVHDCGDDGFALAAEAGGLLEDIKVYNNIAYGNRYVGLNIANWGVPGASHQMRNITVINNTFYDNGQSYWGGGICIENAEAQNVVIRNNLCSQNISFQIAVEAQPSGLTVDHNLIHGYRGYGSEIRGSDYVEGNPLFVNPGAANFALQQGSPAIDRASSLEAPVDDYAGVSRPNGSGFDIGAYEFGGGGPADTQAPTVPQSVSANALSSSRVRLDWDASTDNVMVTGYRIYRDGAPAATSSGTGWTDEGLDPETSYSYRISAYDASGNESGLSAAVEVTTSAAENLALRSNGGRVRWWTSQRAGWEANNLIDGNRTKSNGGAWSSAYRDGLPQILVIELAHRSSLREIVFHSGGIKSRRRPKKVRIYASNQMKTGYEHLRSVKLLTDRNEQSVDLEGLSSGRYRYVGLMITSNRGDANYTQLAEVEVFGK